MMVALPFQGAQLFMKVWKRGNAAFPLPWIGRSNTWLYLK